MNENFDFRNIRSNALGDYDDSDRLKILCERSFFSCNFYENFYKFYKEILVSKMFKYKIFQTGTTTTLLYVFSKIFFVFSDGTIILSNFSNTFLQIFFQF